MSIGILDCLKRKRDICIKNMIPSQNTAFMLAFFRSVIFFNQNRGGGGTGPSPGSATAYFT